MDGASKRRNKASEGMEPVGKASEQNKKAWEHRAYEFWSGKYGTPEEFAAKIKEDPRACLRHHKELFREVEGLRIANVCGSNGRIAVPLALLGARATVFDISEENKRYALALAERAGVSVGYELGDFYGVDLSRFGGMFDIAYLEGGVLHYFHDLPRFLSLLYAIVKPGGRLILSDFHPFRKISADSATSAASKTGGDYFFGGVVQGDVAYKRFFPAEEASDFPDCSLRLPTLSEILNATVGAGFLLRRFDEHPDWFDPKLPGEFTIVADWPEEGAKG